MVALQAPENQKGYGTFGWLSFAVVCRWQIARFFSCGNVGWSGLRAERIGPLGRDPPTIPSHMGTQFLVAGR